MVTASAYSSSFFLALTRGFLLLIAIPLSAQPPTATKIDELKIVHRPSAETSLDSAMLATSRWPQHRLPVHASRGAYARARYWLDRGLMPPENADFGAFTVTPKATANAPWAGGFQLHVECFPSPWRPGHHLLWLEVVAPPADGRPLDVVLISNLASEQVSSPTQVAAGLPTGLSPGDRLGIVGMGVDGLMALSPTQQGWESSVAELRPGRHSLEQLLARGYEMAVRNASPHRSIVRIPLQALPRLLAEVEFIESEENLAE